MSDSDTAHEVLKAIRRIVRKVSEHSKYLSRVAGLTVPQLVSLKTIGELEEQGGAEITVAMVSDSVQLSPATVSRIIDRLVRAGLVSRERRARDRRKVCLSLTDAGLERYQTLPTPLHETFITRLMSLDTSERSHLLDALNHITRLMEAEDLDASPILTPGDDVRPDE